MEPIANCGTIILTGATGGLGRSLVDLLLKLPNTFDIILTIRCLESPKTQSLRQVVGSDRICQILPLELERLESVRSFSTYVRTQISSGKLRPIRALILNAGYMTHLPPNPTIDGYGKEFQINYLANFLLVHKLIRSLDRDRGRIVFITSFTHDPKSRYARAMPLPRHLWQPVEHLARPPHNPREHKSKAGLRRYATSKMCLMMLMHSLQDRLDASEELRNITAVAVDPGWVPATEIMREQSILFRFWVEKVINAFTPWLEKNFTGSLVRTPSRSAADILRIAVPPEDQAQADRVKAVIINGPKVQPGSKESRDKKKQTILWDTSILLADITEGEMAVFEI